MIIINPKDRIQTVIEGDTMGDEHLEGLHAAAEDILSAVESKDSTALVSALHNFFEMCDEMPHEEGPHEEEGYADGGIVWEEGAHDDFSPETAQRRQAQYMGERY